MTSETGLGDFKLRFSDPKEAELTVLRVDEGGDAAGSLGLGQGVEGEGGFARGLRPVDLDDPAFGVASSQRGVWRRRRRNEEL